MASKDAAADPLDLHYEFNQLSLGDLLHARDTYHFHLMNKRNVVGTAVGYYLIRKSDPPPDSHGKVARAAGPHEPRTFGNSEVRDYSWPCVLVLVSKWEDEDQFGGGRPYDPTQMVPKTLFLADGQAVPVCVVLASDADRPGVHAPAGVPMPPAWKLGGGAPITVLSQGIQRTATAGCLVSDGHYTYVLTAAHVCGKAGTPISSHLRGRSVEIGLSSDKTLTNLPFSDAYPEFPSRRSYSTVDVGLITLSDINDWTSNVYGLPALGPLEDAHERNLSLRLIDRQVIGFGAASGLLRGTIKALFYRYRSVGGFDYIGDYLIAPVDGPATRHGDSGMIWNLDLTPDSRGDPVPLAQRQLRPLAVEWGGQSFADGDATHTFAVASNLSTVCRLLDVQLVNDVSRGVSGFWGRVGHYSIAAFAAGLVENATLREFLTDEAVLNLLSFDLDVIKGGKTLEDTLRQIGQADGFTPLADVPDEVWKKLPPPLHPTDPPPKNRRQGGRDKWLGGTLGMNGPEHPNHYADIDAPFSADGKSWRDLCLGDSKNITVKAWHDFYATMAANAADPDVAKQYAQPLKQGLLPLRVWQIFSAMVEFVKAKDVTGFVAAAGILAHYVGDASQPLHGSVLADGDPANLTDRLDKEGKPMKYGEGVHSLYESDMVSRYAEPLITAITSKLPNGHGLPLCSNGKAAAKATLQLMADAAGVLPPQRILDSFENHLVDGRPLVVTQQGMWEDLHDETADVMLLGARTLAMMWDAAWKKGAGKPALLKRPPARADIQARYLDADFLPSCVLDDVAEFLA
ncbi:hypothetical protein ACXPWS_05085 [Mycobacterium sp. BMJ-28]